MNNTDIFVYLAYAIGTIISIALVVTIFKMSASLKLIIKHLEQIAPLADEAKEENSNTALIGLFVGMVFFFGIFLILMLCT